jgi:hypothetical protein
LKIGQGKVTNERDMNGADQCLDNIYKVFMQQKKAQNNRYIAYERNSDRQEKTAFVAASGLVSFISNHSMSTVSGIELCIFSPERYSLQASKPSGSKASAFHLASIAKGAFSSQSKYCTFSRLWHRTVLFLHS